jgi:hypothetical protein
MGVVGIEIRPTSTAKGLIAYQLPRSEGLVKVQLIVIPPSAFTGLIFGLMRSAVADSPYSRNGYGADCRKETTL